MPNITNSNVISGASQLGTGVVESAAILDATIVNADISASAAIALSKISGAAASGANSDITSLSALSTPLSVPQGGTGAATLGDAGVLVGNGTGAIAATGAGTSGQVLTSNGAGVDPTFQTLAVDWNQVGQTINGGASATLSVGSLPARKHYLVFVFFNGSVTGQSDITLNGDTAANYSYRHSTNGGADVTAASAAFIRTTPGGLNGSVQMMMRFSAASGLNKLITWEQAGENGSASAPTRQQGVGLWANTASAITTITLTGSVNYPAGAIMTVYASKD